jgi:hypothetical protein
LGWVKIHYTLGVGGSKYLIFEVISRMTPAPTSAEINNLTYNDTLTDDDEKMP